MYELNVIGGASVNCALLVGDNAAAVNTGAGYQGDSAAPSFFGVTQVVGILWAGNISGFDATFDVGWSVLLIESGTESIFVVDFDFNTGGGGLFTVTGD